MPWSWVWIPVLPSLGLPSQYLWSWVSQSGKHPWPASVHHFRLFTHIKPTMIYKNSVLFQIALSIRIALNVHGFFCTRAVWGFAGYVYEMWCHHHTGEWSFSICSSTGSCSTNTPRAIVIPIPGFFVLRSCGIEVTQCKVTHKCYLQIIRGCRSL